ncbi:MAG: glycosyltransferase [Candidatus Latescibacterota bacterium]|nr:MAG: glycosyltransferase [Candidatus Latescibacterota bacterium]
MTEAKRPRVLLIKPILPYPPNQGTRVASFNLIKALQPHFDVTVLARITSRDQTAHARELERWCSRVVTVMAPNKKSLFHRAAYKLFYQLKTVLFRTSLKTLYDCPGAFLRAAERLSNEPFDLVIVEYWQLQEMMKFFPADKCVLLTHDIDMLVNRQISLLERNLVKKIRAVRRWLLEQKEEVRAYRDSRRVWTLTERDKAAVRRICGDGCEVDVLPVGVDIDFFSPSGMKRNRGEVLFLGHLAASFNRDALDFFIRKIHPRIDDHRELSITIVGGFLPKELEFFAFQRDVEVVGTVEDVRPYLHRASCLVIPLRFGGGLRIRILEAMSAGLPVVCSPVAIAGMPFEPGTEYLVAETPDEFGREIRRILSDEELSGTIATAARAKVRKEYASEVQERRIVSLVNHITRPR